MMFYFPLTQFFPPRIMLSVSTLGFSQEQGVDSSLINEQNTWAKKPQKKMNNFIFFKI